MSKYLEVFGAKTHNLKNVCIKIPKNKLTVITGVSGSGKSSLAFNTIYNVGQQKYLESLSSYARMFVGGLKEEAEYEEIKGLSPTISIEQKTTSKNPRSTVGTITEIYDFYRLLYLNIGKRKCIKCGISVKKDTLENILKYLSEFELNSKFLIKVKINKKFKNFEDLKKYILEKGFIRFSIGKEIYTINTDLELEKIENVFIIIDRLIIKDFSNIESNDTKRLKDSLLLAYKIGKGILSIEMIGKETMQFSNVFICSKCGHVPKELTISSFSFNSHSGACENCHGLGVKKVFLEEKIINFKLTLLEGAVIAPGFGGNYFFALLKEISKYNKLDLNKKYGDLSQEEKKIVLFGTGDKIYRINFKNEYGEDKSYNSKFEGIINTLTRRYFDSSSDKGIYDDFVVDVVCQECMGNRLNKESLSIYLGEKNIGELSNLSVLESIEFFKTLKLTEKEEIICKKVLKNTKERLDFLSGVGLDYMTISRKSSTLSGGEGQRIRLATQIGTKLEGIIYVLDEPSIGLHPRDNDMLIENLKKLRDIGNTLIVVEHDEDIMKNSDYIVDVGPGAGIHGGKIVAKGTLKEIVNDENSITGPYLKDIFSKNILESRIIKRGFRPKCEDLVKNGKILNIIGAKQNNLKNIGVQIPLSNFIVVTGVSGSGKSSLVNDILANYLSNNLNRAKKQIGKVDRIDGLKNLDKTVIIDQSPIGKTPRSNPATYTQVFTHIREVFSMTEEAKIRGYGPGRFSFNTKQGRCEICDGDGVKKIEMHFLPPVYVECEACCGKRYNSETLQIKYKGKNIADILNMTVEEALEFFSSHSKIKKILTTLEKVGLGYIKLGQSSSTLSGGEAQRIKLSTELSKRSTGKTFYILDEPTTGLHFQDVDRLLSILHSLVDKGNTVLVIEHNLDVIINGDYIIDIGPEGGKEGGKLVAYGSINDIVKCNKSYTGKAIKKYLNKK